MKKLILIATISVCLIGCGPAKPQDKQKLGTQSSPNVMVRFQRFQAGGLDSNHVVIVDTWTGTEYLEYIGYRGQYSTTTYIIKLEPRPKLPAEAK